VISPITVDEVQQLVFDASKIRALGTRHSFNSIADTSGALLSTTLLDKIVGLDRDRSTVTVEAGISYGKLAEFLHREGFALANMASLPHISVGGAIATATHGSGVKNGNLSTEVTGLEMVVADGSLISLSRGRSPEFEGAVVSLGALGIVVRVQLQLLPDFEVQQVVYDRLPNSSLSEHTEAILASDYSVSLFTKWSETGIDQVWKKHRVEGSPIDFPNEFYGATLADGPRHMIRTMPWENCTQQGGDPGPWNQRLPHFKMEFTPSSGEELQTEFFVPRKHAMAAIEAVQTLGSQIAPLLHVTEIRTVAADLLWLSPCYEQDCLAIHFTWRAMTPEVLAILPKIEAVLVPFGVRPHWGKIFSTSRQSIESQYVRLPDFRNLASNLDPQGKFQNDFLSRFVL
jgi:xylitol oxidase